MLMLEGCAKPEQNTEKNAEINIAEQQKLINTAKSIDPVNNEKISEILGKLSDLNYQLIIDIKLFDIINATGNSCSQLKYDESNIELQIEAIKFRRELAEKDSSPGLINYYKNHKNDTWKLSEIDAQIIACGKDGNFKLIKKDSYNISLKEHEDINKGLKSRYKKENGVDFDVAYREILDLDSEFFRKQSWDKLSQEEKNQVSGNNYQVESCLNATLNSNSNAEKISNIVKDTAVLCKQGLGVGAGAELTQAAGNR